MKGTRILLFAVLLAGNSPTSWGQGLTAFTYQGRLDDSGNPVTGLYDFAFKLFNAANGGGQVGGTFNTNGVAVTNGIFSVAVDFGPGVFDGSGRRLDIAVKSNGLAIALTPLAPRQPLTHAPMAQYALTPAGPAGPQGPAGATGAAGPAGPEGLNWRGAWSAGTAYAIDDAVSHNGSSWAAKLANTGSTPVEGSANWDLLAKKGDTGTAGPQGAAGATGPQGPAGPQGLTGATGPQGPQGVQGPQGSAGSSGAFSLSGTNAVFSGGNVGIGTANPGRLLQLGDASVPGSQGMLRLASRSATGNYTRMWDVGVPEGGDSDGDGRNYSFVIDDTALGTAPEFVVKYGSGNVGIGTANPQNKLEVEGDTRIHGQLLVRGGDVAPFVVVTESGMEAFAVASGGSGVFEGSVFLNSDLWVEGHAYKNLGGTSWETFSDRRLKQDDVRPYEPGLNEVLQLRPVRFHYRDDPKRGLSSDHEEVGFIAQEVREVIPDAVAEGKDGYLTLKADPIHWAAINAIQQLNAKLEDKDARIAILEQQMNEMKALLRELTTKKENQP